MSQITFFNDYHEISFESSDSLTPTLCQKIPFRIILELTNILIELNLKKSDYARKRKPAFDIIDLFGYFKKDVTRKSFLIFASLCVDDDLFFRKLPLHGLIHVDYKNGRDFGGYHYQEREVDPRPYPTKVLNHLTKSTKLLSLRRVLVSSRELNSVMTILKRMTQLKRLHIELVMKESSISTQEVEHLNPILSTLETVRLSCRIPFQDQYQDPPEVLPTLKTDLKFSPSLLKQLILKNVNFTNLLTTLPPRRSLLQKLVLHSLTLSRHFIETFVPFLPHLSCLKLEDCILSGNILLIFQHSQSVRLAKFVDCSVNELADFQKSFSGHHFHFHACSVLEKLSFGGGTWGRGGSILPKNSQKVLEELSKLESLKVANVDCFEYGYGDLRVEVQKSHTEMDMEEMTQIMIRGENLNLGESREEKVDVDVGWMYIYGNREIRKFRGSDLFISRKALDILIRNNRNSLTDLTLCRCVLGKGVGFGCWVEVFEELFGKLEGLKKFTGSGLRPLVNPRKKKEGGEKRKGLVLPEGSRLCSISLDVFNVDLFNDLAESFVRRKKKEKEMAVIEMEDGRKKRWQMKKFELEIGDVVYGESVVSKLSGFGMQFVVSRVKNLMLRCALGSSRMLTDFVFKLKNVEYVNGYMCSLPENYWEFFCNERFPNLKKLYLASSIFPDRNLENLKRELINSGKRKIVQSLEILNLKKLKQNGGSGGEPRIPCELLRLLKEECKNLKKLYLSRESIDEEGIRFVEKEFPNSFPQHS